MATTLTPEQYAGDAEGAYANVRIEDAVNRAEAMVHGEDEKTVTDDYLNFRMTQVTPMTATSLANWFHESMGVTIKPSRIWKWAERGNISRANTQGHPTYHPADVLRAHYETKAA